MNQHQRGELDFEASLDRGLRISTDQITLRDHSTDFGGLSLGRPRGVVHPKSPTDVALCFNRLSQAGIKCSIRGKGYSQSGQALPDDGWVLSTQFLDSPPCIDEKTRRVRVGAGRTVRELQCALRESGLTLPVIPLNLDMTLGGLVTAGGIGSNSHSYGPVVSTLHSATLVTPDGQVRQTSREESPELFNHLCGGFGRIGVAVDLEFETRALPIGVQREQRLFHSLKDCLSAMCELASTRDTHIETLCWFAGMCDGIPSTSRPDSSINWVFQLQTATELHELSGNVAPSYPKFSARYEPRFGEMVGNGQWEQSHPWFEVFFSCDQNAPAVLTEILSMAPPSLGFGHRIMMTIGANAPSSFMLPSPDLNFCFAILPLGIGQKALPAARAALSRIDEFARKMGGKRYLSGWLGPDWASQKAAEHFDSQLQQREKVVRCNDPTMIVSNCLEPLGGSC